MYLVRHGQSEFNVHFGRTRQDPGIRDAPLTDEGRRQAEAASRHLKGLGIERIIASPYSRALMTAEILARHIDAPIVAIEPLVGEHAKYACDIGTSPRDLALSWPHIDFSHLSDPWWPSGDETEEALHGRAQSFRSLTDDHDLRDRTVVVSHWGFIRALTGLAVTNCAIVKFDVKPAPRAVLHAEVATPIIL